MIVEVESSDYFLEVLNTDYIERLVVEPDDGGAGWRLRLIIRSGNIEETFEDIDEATAAAEMWQARMNGEADGIL